MEKICSYFLYYILEDDVRKLGELIDHNLLEAHEDDQSSIFRDMGWIPEQLELYVQSADMVLFLQRRGFLQISSFLIRMILQNWTLKSAVDFFLTIEEVWWPEICEHAWDADYDILWHFFTHRHEEENDIVQGPSCNVFQPDQSGKIHNSCFDTICSNSEWNNQEELKLVASLHPNTQISPSQLHKPLNSNRFPLVVTFLPFVKSEKWCVLKDIVIKSNSQEDVDVVRRHSKPGTLNLNITRTIIDCGRTAYFDLIDQRGIDVSTIYFKSIHLDARVFLSNRGCRLNNTEEEPYSEEAENNIYLLSHTRYNSLSYLEKMKFGVRSLTDYCADFIRREWWLQRSFTWNGNKVVYKHHLHNFFTPDIENDHQLLPTELWDRLHLEACKQRKYVQE